MSEVGFSKEFTGHLKNDILCFLDKDRTTDQTYSDVTIITENGDIKAHKCVLVACSEYFRTMLQSMMKERSTGVIDLKHLKHAIVKLVMEYIYSSRVKITSENVFDVLHCADYMALHELKNFCRDILFNNINGSNCLSIRAYAKRYGLENVLAKAHNFIVDNLVDIRQNQEYLELTFDDLLQLLKQRSSKTPEYVVYESIIQWMQHKVEERKEFLPQLITAVDLEKLSPAYLAANVATQPLLKQSLDCQHRIIQAYESHLGVKQKAAEGQTQTQYLEEEKATFRRMMETPKQEGHVWMLADSKWIQKWRNYDVMNEGYPPPGPLDNSPLFRDEECTQLKENLKEGEDYVAMPTDAWDFLTRSHGVIRSQPNIRSTMKKVVTNGIEEVKLDPDSPQLFISLQFYRSGQPNNKQTAELPLSKTIREVKDHITEQLVRSVGPDNRQYVRRENGEELKDNLTLAHSGLTNGDVLVYRYDR